MFTYDRIHFSRSSTSIDGCSFRVHRVTEFQISNSNVVNLRLIRWRFRRCTVLSPVTFGMSVLLLVMMRLILFFRNKGENQVTVFTNYKDGTVVISKLVGL